MAEPDRTIEPSDELDTAKLLEAVSLVADITDRGNSMGLGLVAYPVPEIETILGGLSFLLDPSRPKAGSVGYLMSIIDAAIEDGFDPDEDGPLLDEIRAKLKAIPFPDRLNR